MNVNFSSGFSTLRYRSNTIVDSTLIAAPSSTNNLDKKRNPDARQTKKGNTWHFGCKAHIGVDKISGLVQHVKGTAANVHDVTVVPKLLYGEEVSVHGDSRYLGAHKHEDAITHNSQGKKIQYKINPRPSQSKTTVHVPKLKSSGESGKSHLFGPRTNMFLGL